jgi:hypothetical protein
MRNGTAHGLQKLMESSKVNADEKCGKNRRRLLTPMILLSVALMVFTEPLAPQMTRAEGLSPEYRINAGMELIRLNWSEYLGDGFKLVSETGWLIGATYDLESTVDGLGWRHGAGLFFGRVDYDGHTWSLIPVKTDVWYIGAQGHLDALFRFHPASDLTVWPFTGIGVKTWLRTLDDTRTAGGIPVNGAEEWWWSIYGRFGAGTRYTICENMFIFADAGIKLPIHARNNAYLEGRSAPVRITQYQTASPFAVCGVRYHWMTVSLILESQRFNRSDAVAADHYTLYQPRSKEDIIAIRASWTSALFDERCRQ